MPTGQGVAIVGIGCRFPGGADDPQRFWDLLARGVDATVEAPPGRLDVDALYDPDPERRGTVYVRRGGYLEAIEEFDAEFFGISPREARRIDPQQRLLLEVAWEALEDAGQPAGALAGTRTGVFVGIAGHDYGDLQSRPDARELIDVHVTAGSATSIAANRISYVLDLRGPSLTVDTACSSSLTAVHLACRSLADGECDVALAGAVNALITPEPTIGFCKAGMLAPDGRCKPFDAAADGYARGEGAGVVVLKPLARARADGDLVYAVIRATAVNQDGHTIGISVPSPEAQEALLRDALRRAGLRAGDVQVVEAHGTGTPVGDPREALALGRVLGAGPRAEPCVIGSAKGNLGHLEAAAGIAGLIKTALALEHRAVPPTVNFARPNPAIDFAGLNLRVGAALEPWPLPEGARAVAGVNSFGFGGANAHAILEEAPAHAPARRGAPDGDAQLLALSARSDAALRAQARRHAGWLRDSGVEARDACATAALHRTHHEHRLAAVGATSDELGAQLETFAEGQPAPKVACGRAARAPKLAFVFSGMGPQWWGMGRGLLRDEPVFAAAIDECDRHLRPLAGWSLRAELERDEAGSRVAATDVAHAANLALQTGLVRLWREWGVVPDAVVGHSSGEMGAACAAGALTLPDAVRLAFHRGRLQHRTAGTGGMLAAGVCAEEAPLLLRGRERRVALAAVNGPQSVTFSGELDALAEIAGELERAGRFGRMLSVPVPYHGPQMDALRDELLDTLADLSPQSPAIPLVSTVTAEWQNGQPLDAAYWWRNVRQPVRFADAVRRLADDGCSLFVELAPHPALAPALTECLAGTEATVLASLRRGEDDRTQMLHALAALHVRGREVAWEAVLSRDARRVRMPTYPWQRERHWVEEPAATPAGVDSGHPLLGRRTRGPRPAWEAPLGDERLAFLEGHRIQGRVVFPGAAHVELALAAARALHPDAATAVLEDVAFERLLTVTDRAALTLGCVAGEDLEIHSAAREEPDVWTRRAHVHIAAPRTAARAPLDLAAARARCREHVDGESLYATLRRRHGLDYDGAFRGAAALWRGDGEALGEIALPDGVPTAGWHVHPALLDAAFHVLAAAAPLAQDQPFVPVAIARVELLAPPGERCLSHAELCREGDGLTGTVTLADAEGHVLLRCEGVRLRALAAPAPAHDDWLHEERWEPAPRAGAAVAPVREIAAATASYLDGAAPRLGTYYAEVEPALDGLALGFVRDALAALGDRSAVAARHRRLHARLEALAATRAEVTAPDPDALATAHPECASAVELVCESGRRLAATLRGEQDAREWLVAGPSLHALTDLYATSPGFTVYGDAVAEAVAAAASGAPAGTLRMLEVGAGTGGATARILDRLDAPPREYVFSDLSPFFLRAARERFAARPELSTAVIDVEDPPAAAGGFDIVIAADVVHATADALATLRHLRALLAPGGALVLMEAARPSAWLDLVFGQLEGWWRARDREHPLLAPEAWRALLDEAGFANPTVVADAPDPVHALLVASAPAARVSSRRRLVLSDREVGPALVAGLRERGDRCMLAWPGAGYTRFGEDGVELDPADPEAWARLLADAGAIDAIVDLWALDAPGTAASTDELLASQRTSCGAIVALTQALTAAGRALPETWIVTAGAQVVAADGEDASVAQAPSWGVGRVLRTEQGRERCRLVDLGAERADPDLEALLAELARPDGDEPELAFRVGRRYARRLGTADLAPPPAPRAVRVSPQDAGFRATVARPGALESLALRATTARAPGPGEVEILVRAAGLNFRDVLVALGVAFAAGGEDPARTPLGWECAGVVTACGPGVDAFAPGDEVVAIAAGALGSRVVALADRVARKPAGLDFEQAATLPVAFLTAQWALERLAQVRAGERVLVHCASGGVGLAAVQLVRRAGAEVLATAGTPDKRAYLRSLGVEHVMDSRTLDWVGGVRDATDGEGVDVVLNSLAGEAVDAGVSVLRPHGRFVEIGKRDIYEGGCLALAPFRANLSYFALDLHPLYAERPATIGGMLRAIVADVERGELTPLPHHDFDAAATEPAFRFMAQARHTGKVVVTLRERDYAVEPAAAPALLRGDGAYVVTGGLGGFGLRIAQWLAREGAGAVVLTGRRGAPRDEDLPALEALRASPADVHVLRADAADAGATARLLAEVRDGIGPVRGVVHAAMVLDDALLGTLDYARFEAVLAPKLAGAWNLHVSTAGDELDLFVMFSSISVLIGQVAQSAYAAGNAFLGALAAHRRACGLHALTIDWGTIADAGYVARRPELGRRLERQGLAGIPAATACALLGELLRRDVTRMGVSAVDWSTPSAASATSPEQPAATAAEGAHLRARVLAAGADERRPLLERHLSQLTARVLESDPGRVDLDRRLPDLGIDSLMAVEIRTALRADLDVEVPIVDLLERLTLRELAGDVLERLDA